MDKAQTNRRCDGRRADNTAATAFVLDGGEFGTMVTLSLTDVSDRGMGARCSQPVARSAVLSLGFAAHDRWARRGVVRWCREASDGFHLGIEFEAGLAA